MKVQLKQKQRYLLAQREQTVMRRCVEFWRCKLDQKQILRQRSELGKHLCRQRQTSQYLHKWLTALRIRLKKRQLNANLGSFENKRKIKVFGKWRSAFLWRQVQQQEFYQTRKENYLKFMRKVVQKWREHSVSKRNKVQQMRVAKQQYIY